MEYYICLDFPIFIDPFFFSQTFFRFIQPVRRRSKRRYEHYDKSPVFDSIVPVTGNVCSHKNGCDEFLLKVQSFQIIIISFFSFQKDTLFHPFKLFQKNQNNLGTENVFQNRYCNRVDTEYIEKFHAYKT